MKIPPKKEKRWSFKKRWAPELQKYNFTQISNFFLENYSHLKPYHLTLGEAMFVIHLMQYKWGRKAPYPSYKTLAHKMHVDEKTVRRHAASLEGKKYLHREMREGTTNKFHLKGLMDALVAFASKKESAKPKPKSA